MEDDDSDRLEEHGVARDGSFSRQQNDDSVAQSYIPHVITGEDASISPYESPDLPNTTIRDFSAGPSPYIPRCPQTESSGFGFDNIPTSSASGREGKARSRTVHKMPQQQMSQSCQICGKNSQEDPRAMVYFAPTASAPSAVYLHVFCGKTASILPQMPQPHFEIMLKAGLKNKHGIGPDVNFALARTRSALAQGGEADQDPKRLDKEYYLVKEFEGHLNSVRSFQHRKTHVASMPPQMAVPAPLHASVPPSISHTIPGHLFTDVSNKKPKARERGVHKVSQSYRKPSQRYHRYEQQRHYSQQKWTETSENIANMATQSRTSDLHQGRVQCPCGGIYNENKAASCRAHLKTKRHIQWASCEPISNSLDSSHTHLNIMSQDSHLQGGRMVYGDVDTSTSKQGHGEEELSQFSSQHDEPHFND